ncbi:hypothetical protein BH09MYX1_BH09MYX1_67150 [soil metagenome]
MIRPVAVLALALTLSGCSSDPASSPNGTPTPTPPAGANDGIVPATPAQLPALSSPFRYGMNVGHPNADWGDDEMGLLAAQAGADSERIKLPETHLTTWGWDIEVGDIKSYAANGMKDHVGFLCTPTAAHSTMPSGKADWELEYWAPRNLHQPIFLADGSVNPDNFWAAYVEKTVKTYSPWVRIWEVWNEPDWVSDWQVVEGWKTNPPKASELPRFNGSIFDYVRMLRVTWMVVHKVDPTARVATGGIGYPSFLNAILRYTDEPKQGAVDEAHPKTGGAWFDVLDFHYYPIFQKGNSDASVDDFMKSKASLAAELAAANVTGKEWNVTETGAPRQSVDGAPGSDAYARNYLVKALLTAQAQGILGIDWFILSDGKPADVAKDSFASMGLWFDVSTLKVTTDARMTPSGTAMLGMTKLLRGARVDLTATTALGLATNVGGIVFVTKEQKHVWVLWARGTDEQATGAYAIASAKPLTMYLWDHAVTSAKATIASNAGKVNAPLESAPRYFVED